MLRSLINQRLGRYYIKELLGRGGMAAVYRATDTVLQRDVALKVLYPQFGDDESLVLRFQREAVTAAALEHPGIVPVYDVGEQDGMAYIAMKLLSGETLQARLQAAGALPPAEVLALLQPVAGALDYAHSKGVVHRDIKPANIFLSATPDGVRVMLTDFGIAKQLDTPGLTTTGALIGTPDYMAPEQIAGRPVDGRADVYALGMLAYRALTGRRAFEGSTQDVLLGHLYNDPPPPSQLNPALPPAVDGVIATAIAREPAARYESAGAFVAALAGAAAGAPAGTAVGRPPALAAPPAPTQAPAVAATRRAPPPQPAYPAAPRVGGGAAAAAATVETSGAATLPAARRAGGLAPWLIALALALVTGGLAMALFFALGRGDGAGAVPSPVPPPPPTAAPSATAAPADTATATPAATDTPAPAPSATEAAPTATVPLAVTAPTMPPPPTVPAPATAEPPTATAEPPTATATPTAEPPTATPTATEPPAADCDERLLAGGFGKLFYENVAVRTNLGCPQEPEVAGNGSIQFFERGTMFYWDAKNKTPESDFIYVFYGLDAGEHDVFSPAQVSALEPEPTAGPDPEQPVRGFGRVYFLSPGARERLGLWQSPEIELKGNRRAVIQRFEQGLMIFTPTYQPTGGRSIFVLYNDGSFDRFNDTFAG
jgi:serine/threonine-protein kinase